MIKVNLLNNQFEAPVQPETTHDTKESVARVIKQEARKSSRRVAMLMIFFSLIAAGVISLVIYRYEVIAYVEQYTGPLNLLEPIEEGPSPAELEEQRREKIRQLYMDNTIRIHARDMRYFDFVDSLKRLGPVFIRYATLDNNDYSVECFSRSEQELKDFTTAFLRFRSLESNKVNEIEPNRQIPGFRFRRVINGTLRVPAVADEPLDVKTSYLMVDKTHKKMQLLALEEKIDVKFSSDMKSVKGVVMTKHSGDLKASGSIGAYLKFLNKVNRQYLNIEFTHHEVTYPAPGTKSTPSVTAGYNVLIPTAIDEPAKN